MAGCTKNFDNTNTDPTKLSEMTSATVGNAFALTIYRGLYGDPGLYQLARNLFADYYSQLFAVRDAGIRSDRYVIVQDWIISQWNCMYTVTWPTLKQILELTAKTDTEANALAKIWKVFVFHSNTDFYGPIPYSQAGKGEVSIPYDSQHDIYYDFFTLLDEATASLAAADQTKKPFGDNDLIFHGDIGQWRRFANSLRLRLALRISKIDPQKAKEEAEKAVAAGVMVTNLHSAFMKVNANTVNGLNVITDWGEGFVMSATMESYLRGFKDPRMPVYFSPGRVSGVYRGIRNGLTAEQMNSSPLNAAGAASNLGPRFLADQQTTNPLFVMYAAESFFLRAEGAVNGWNMGGTAEDLYRQGIQTSMEQWGITDQSKIDAYINGTSKPIALSDYLKSPAVSDIPVKFAAIEEQQRQQIGTQKWLSIYPDGIEAWAEVRRTGYPKLYPVVNSDNPDIAATELIRRFPYLDYEKQTNALAEQKGVELLGGPDKPTTRLWWNP
ncbi:Susd and RagB outer membrane lipoprotein [bacterium A37T11]|nr:Susd and RagB outer membrane lipoprotein [bacterium A37T11]